MLNKGLKYGINPRFVDVNEILSNFEILAQTLNKSEISPIDHKNDLPINPKQDFNEKLKTLAFDYI